MARKTSGSQAKATALTESGLQTIRTIVGLAIIIFVVSGLVWWRYVQSNPTHVFNAMLDNNLKTLGVTDQIWESNSSQSLNQITQLNTTPLHVAHGQTVLAQNGGTDTEVITETIGTPYADYVRYVDVVTSQTDKQGKKLDFSSVKNVWGKAETGGPDQQTTGELYNQTVLGVVPFGNLAAGQRKELLKLIKERHVYDVDYTKVDKRSANGRPEYVYNVSINPGAYVSLLKEFAANLGLTQLQDIEPVNYNNAPPVKFQVGIDVWSAQLSFIKYSNSNRTETFSAYGARRPVQLPAKTIPIEELQQRIQSLQ